MYGAFDSDKKLIAFHDDKDVVDTYVISIKHYHDIDLTICKIKKNAMYKLNGKEDLYLVRYGSTYVQSGYVKYIQLASTQILDDDKYVLDVLYRILELEDELTKKEGKIIYKAIQILERLVSKDKEYTPSYQELQRLKTDYDPYLYKYDF